MINGRKGSKFKFTVTYETGPVAEIKSDRAMDILAMWIARKYKAEHPEEFKKPQTVENSPAKTDSSDDLTHSTGDLEAA